MIPQGKLARFFQVEIKENTKKADAQAFMAFFSGHSTCKALREAKCSWILTNSGEELVIGCTACVRLNTVCDELNAAGSLIHVKNILVRDNFTKRAGEHERLLGNGALMEEMQDLRSSPLGAPAAGVVPRAGYLDAKMLKGVDKVRFS